MVYSRLEKCCREGHYCKSLGITAVEEVSQEVYRKPLSNTLPVIDKQGFDQDNWKDIWVWAVNHIASTESPLITQLNAKKTGGMENLGQITEFLLLNLSACLSSIRELHS